MNDAVSGHHRGRAVLFALATGRFRYAALLTVMATSSQPSFPTLVRMSVSLRLAEAPLTTLALLLYVVGVSPRNYCVAHAAPRLEVIQSTGYFLRGYIFPRPRCYGNLTRPILSGSLRGGWSRQQCDGA